MANGVYGQRNVNTGNTDYNQLSFVIRQLINQINTATLVRVVAVHGGGLGPVGTVDILPLVDQVAGDGTPILHTTVFGVPFFRLQGGVAAIICDPQVGDIGYCVFADHDISGVKATHTHATPASKRRFDFADGLYLGGWDSQLTPTQYLQLGLNSITIKGDSLITQTQTVDMTATESVDITSPQTTITGLMTVTGLITGTTTLALAIEGTGGSMGGSTIYSVTQPPPGSSVTSMVELGGTFATNQAFKLIAGLAQPVTSLDADRPSVDGIVLESGHLHNVVSAAMLAGNTYTTPLVLPSGTDLFLGQDGKPTATVPSIGAGDVWSVRTIRREDATHFLFVPTKCDKLA
jgi:hypothetical protein